MKVTRIVLEFDKEVSDEFVSWVASQVADTALLVGAQVVTTAESIEVVEIDDEPAD